jgi:hypothetical protein
MKTFLTLVLTTPRRSRGRAVIAVALAFACASCTTVRPHERATLADPSMQFDEDPHAESMRRHAIDNREGSMGGSGVAGGGCGCN